MRKGWLRVLSTVVCLTLFVFFAVGSMDEPEENTDKIGVMEEPVPEEAILEEEEKYVSNEPVEAEGITDAVKVSGKSLFSAYAANAVSADEKYYGQYLDVEGTVEGHSKDMFGKFIVEISSGSDKGCVQCFMEPKYVKKAKELRTGQFVRIRGRCDGFANSTFVMLKRCIILPED